MGIFDTNEAPVYPIRNRAIEYIPDIFEGRISFPLNKSPTQDARLEDIPSDRDLQKSRSEGELVKGNNFDVYRRWVAGILCGCPIYLDATRYYVPSRNFMRKLARNPAII